MAINTHEKDRTPIKNGSRYEKTWIKKVVQLVEEGMSRKTAYDQFGMSQNSLQNWLKKYGSDVYHQDKRMSFTPLQKHSIICAVMQGKLTTREAKNTYDIKDEALIKRWIRKYKRQNPHLCKVTAPFMAKEKTTPASADIKELESQLEEAQLKIVALNTLIDVAEKQLKINIRKKPGAKQSHN
jgi:transposase-like protein